MQESTDNRLGLRRGTVRLVAPTPDWKEAFEQERCLLRERLGAVALDIQHVGSTAVPGLPAKPIIDIAIAVARLDDYAGCVDPLAAIGYTYFPERNPPEDRFFAKGPEACRTHYLHFVAIDGEPWRNYLLFRDYLVAHPQMLATYTELKRKMARRYASDRRSYTASKSTFVAEVLALARSALSDANCPDPSR